MYIDEKELVVNFNKPFDVQIQSDISIVVPLTSQKFNSPETLNWQW